MWDISKGLFSFWTGFNILLIAVLILYFGTLCFSFVSVISISVKTDV